MPCTAVSSDATIEQSETIMLGTNRECVPVVDDSKKCVGVLSHSDILRVRSAKEDLSSKRVREIMSRRVISVSPNSSVDNAMKLMLDNGVHHVLVLVGGQVEGIVSVIDIIQVDRARTFNAFADPEAYVPVS